MLFDLLLFAVDDTKPEGGAPALVQLVPFLVGGMLLLFMFRRTGQKDQERQAFLKTLEKNDKVLTTAGIYGTVVSVSEKEDEVTVRVDDNVRLKMIKGSIARNLTKEEALKQAKEPKTS